MSSQNPIKVTAAIIKRAGKILIAKRKMGKHLGGLWEFPGGKIEDGESPEECLERELKEELGINTKVGNFVTSNIYTYKRMTINLMAYNTEFISGDLILEQHDEIQWVTIPEMSNFKFAPADIPIIEELQ